MTDNVIDEYGSFYLMNIKVNTGYTLEELIREGVMDGQVIDHSPHGNCVCVDVSGTDMEGLHFRCACNHPIRWAYPVNMRGGTFYFGSTCIKHWWIRCPDCKNVNSFDKHIVNTVDQCYRCEDCHEIFLRKRREKQKEERDRKKKQEEEREAVLDRERDRKKKHEAVLEAVLDRERYRKKKQEEEREAVLDRERDELVARVEREHDEYMKKMERKCTDCKSSLGNAPSWKVRCFNCFKKHKSNQFHNLK